MLSGAQSPAHPRGAALSPQPHPVPRSVGEGFKWPGHSDRGTDAGGGFRGSFERQARFSQGQNEGHALPSAPVVWPPALPTPNRSGREGVNLPASQQECGAINTHSLAVCQSGSLPAPSPREQGAGLRERAPV